MRALVLLLALAGCSASDPCDGHAGTCLSLRVEDRGGVGVVDQLAIRMTGVAQLDGTTPPTPRSVRLPVATAIYLRDGGGRVDVTVRGLRAGAPVGLGQVTTMVPSHAHTAVVVGLWPLAGADLGLVVDDAAVDAAATAPDLQPPPRHIFLLPAQSSNLGPRRGLDDECTSAATSAGLPSQYRAVISYPGANPREQLALSGNRPIVLPSGSPVATDGTFFGLTHLGPINQMADGTTATGCVFTDFNYNGDRIMATEGDCGGWTGNATATAYVGEAASSDMHWSFAGTASCNKLQCFVYCLEQ
jgi:hypothetical protein